MYDIPLKQSQEFTLKTAVSSKIVGQHPTISALQPSKHNISDSSYPQMVAPYQLHRGKVWPF
jgi:hypothetical protein